MSNIPEVIKYKDAVYNYVNGGVISGYTKRGSIPEEFPRIWWNGSKISHALWKSIIAFFEWTYNKSKDEALVYLYYNEETNQWMAWAPPQRGVGMSVRTVDNHVNWKQQEEFSGFVRVGTGHHHCSTKAFQSGTDSNDEFTGNGLHFTVGSMDKEFHDLHARAVFNGNMIEVELDDWVELADRYKTPPIHPEFLKLAYDYSLQSAAPKETEVPQMWKDNFLSWSSSDGTNNVGFHCHASRDYRDSQADIGGANGYWRETNGAKEFVPFVYGYNGNQSHTSKTSGSVVTITTPSERGGAMLDDLQRKGLSVTALNIICDDLKTTNRKYWAGGKDHLAVIDVIKSNGLNVGWLEKYIIEEEACKEALEQNRYFEGI